MPALAAVLGAAELAAKSAAGLSVLAPNEYDRAEKKRLADLKRRQEIGALGLSQGEEDQLYDEFQAQQSVQQEALAQARRQQLGSAIGFGGGEALGASIASEEASRRLGAEQVRAVQAQDIARAREEEDEMWAREANASERRQEKVQAILGAGLTATEGISGMVSQKNTLEGSGVSGAQFKELGDSLGISGEDAAGLFENLSGSPDLLALISGI